MTKKEEVKAKIQELVSEIMELKFGCLLKNERLDLIIPITKERFDGDVMIRDWDGWHTPAWVRENYTILGRPITLADVLLAVEKRVLDTNRASIKKEVGYLLDKTYLTILTDWKLPQPYDNQPEEVYELLHNILID